MDFISNAPASRSILTNLEILSCNSIRSLEVISYFNSPKNNTDMVKLMNKLEVNK